jgi:hypothetical protein
MASGERKAMTIINHPATRDRMPTSRHSSPWPYLALACGWSWLFWGPAALAGWRYDAPTSSSLPSTRGLSNALLCAPLGAFTPFTDFLQPVFTFIAYTVVSVGKEPTSIQKMKPE